MAGENETRATPTPEDLGKWLHLYLEAGGALSGFTLREFLSLDEDEQTQAVLAGGRFWEGLARRFARALRAGEAQVQQPEDSRDAELARREANLMEALAREQRACAARGPLEVDE